jgi:two-component system sensor histidine kinase UhpB
LSRELHDETAQVFSAMTLQLGLLRESVGDSGPDRLATMSDLVATGLESIRRVAEDLRPPVLDDLGLTAALQAIASDFQSQCATPVRFERAEAIQQPSDDAELALFRTLQEALANVARHAGASNVRVALAQRGTDVVLTVEDDGRGFDRDVPGDTGRMGLVGMQERLAGVGGGLILRSEPGRGTSVEARVPIRGERA